VPPRAIGAYAGVFEHPGYGRVVVQSRADAARPLGFEYNGMRSSAAHHHHEVFRVPPSSTDLLDETVLHFVPDAEGDIRELRLRLEPALPPIVFRRLPDGELLLRERLLRFVGDYAGPAGLLSVALGADGVLTLVQGGGTAQTLQPIAGARFAVQGREDLQLLFRLPTAADAAQADGKADAVVMLMPRRNLLAPRRP
jgi:hypothetical protein